MVADDFALRQRLLQFSHARGGDLSKLSQIKAAEFLQLGHVLEALVADLSAAQDKPFEVLQLGQVLEACVGDLSVKQPKRLETL